MREFLIKGPRVCLENQLTEAGSHGILCDPENGEIKAIVDLNTLSGQAALKNFELIEWVELPENYVILPGFIDLHIHGAEGFDFMDATPEALVHISKALLQQGTTGFFATTMTESEENIQAALKNIAQVFRGSHPHQSNQSHQSQSDAESFEILKAQLLGVHLEGPFLAPSRMGAQCGEKIISPSIQKFEKFQNASGGKIKLVTLAPEVSGAFGFIEYLVKEGVVASIGHTDSTFAEARQAIEAGASYATHLFNAMRGIHHREPGCACAILMDSRVSAELIADGVHVHPDMLKFAVSIKGSDKIILVTDAMRAQCLGEGIFDLGGQKVHVKNQEARLLEGPNQGVLAGSVLSMREAFLNILKFTDLDWVDATRLVSTNPAKIAKCFDSRGSIAAGKRADLVVMTPEGQIHGVLFGGKWIKI
jgi:N-acetylglucosamine-6-phosphate deacetylase